MSLCGRQSSKPSVDDGRKPRLSRYPQAAIGCRFLRNRNQLAFVEYSKGLISLLDLVCQAQSIISQGTVVLKGTYVFDCETGVQDGNLSGPGDIWWEQEDPIHR